MAFINGFFGTLLSVNKTDKDEFMGQGGYETGSKLLLKSFRTFFSKRKGQKKNRTELSYSTHTRE